MKQLLYLILVLFVQNSVFAQQAVDTINVRGKVTDESGNSIADALVLTQAHVKKKLYPATRTDKDGNFKLDGIAVHSDFWIYSEKGNHRFTVNGSRYLLIRVPLFKPRLIHGDELATPITAKKTKARAKIEPKKAATSAHYMTGNHIEYSAGYPGGMTKFLNQLKANITYPAAAVANGIEGDVIIEFTINKEGLATDPIIIRDIGYGCSEQVVQAIKKSKKWSPALQNGKTLSTVFNVKIPFQLID